MNNPKIAFGGGGVVKTQSRDHLERVVSWLRRWLPMMMAWVSGLHASLALVRWHEGDVLWQLHASAAVITAAFAILIGRQPDNDGSEPPHEL